MNKKLHIKKGDMVYVNAGQISFPFRRRMSSKMRQ